MEMLRAQKYYVFPRAGFKNHYKTDRLHFIFSFVYILSLETFFFYLRTGQISKYNSYLDMSRL